VLSSALDLEQFGNAFTDHTHSVWTHSSQEQIIRRWQLPPIHGYFLGIAFVSSGASIGLLKRISPIGPISIGITLEEWKEASATLVLSISSSWRAPLW